RMVRGVFFDLDDTLAGSEVAQRAAILAGWHAAFGDLPVDDDALLQAIAETYREQFDYGTPGYAELAHLPVEELVRQVTAGGLARLGIQLPPSLDPLVAAARTAERAALAALDGAADLLVALRARGLKVGLITNGPGALQREKLALLALGDLFDV